MYIKQKEEILSFLDENIQMFRQLTVSECIEKDFPPEIIKLALLLGMNPFQECDYFSLKKAFIRDDFLALKFFVDAGMTVDSEIASKVLYDIIKDGIATRKKVRYLLYELNADIHWGNDKIIEKAKSSAPNDILSMIFEKY